MHFCCRYGQATQYRLNTDVLQNDANTIDLGCVNGSTSAKCTRGCPYRASTQCLQVSSVYRNGTTAAGKLCIQLRPTKKVTCLFYGAADSAVANIGIDFTEKVAAHHCGFQLQMLLVGRDYSSPPCHLSRDPHVTSQPCMPLARI